MKQNLFLLLLFLISFNVLGKKISINVSLSPAGSFIAKSSNVSGKVNFKEDENRVWASRLKVPTNSFDTGMSLRNEHFIKHLKGSKYPNILVKKFRGKKGKGTATLIVTNKKKKISVSYIIKEDNLIASFKVNTVDLGLKKVKYLGVGVKDVVTIEVEIPIERK